jgi:hypothetical protein
VALNSSGAYASATQCNSGGAWSPFKTIAAPQGLTITFDLASDDAGPRLLTWPVVRMEYAGNFELKYFSLHS